MKTEKFHYENECTNCGLKYEFDYKDEHIQSTTCPSCTAPRQIPIKILKIENFIVNRVDLET